METLESRAWLFDPGDIECGNSVLSILNTRLCLTDFPIGLPRIKRFHLLSRMPPAHTLSSFIQPLLLATLRIVDTRKHTLSNQRRMRSFPTQTSKPLPTRVTRSSNLFGDIVLSTKSYLRENRPPSQKDSSIASYFKLRPLYPSTGKLPIIKD